MPENNNPHLDLIASPCIQPPARLSFEAVDGDFRDLLTRWDQNDGMWMETRDDEPAISPDEATGWQPRQGDLAIIIDTDTVTPRGARLGQKVWVDYSYPAGYGAGPIFSAVYLTPTRVHDTNEYRAEYFNIASSGLAPDVPTEHGQMVRCVNTEHQSARYHQYVEECVSPVRMIRNGDWERHLVDSFREVFADELAERNRERDRLLSRVGEIRVGGEYMILPGHSYGGNVARIYSLPSTGGTDFICSVSSLDGDIMRNQMRISILSLGDRLTVWQRANNPPPFIQFTHIDYSGRVAVVDREVSDSVDEHDCDVRCFDYGCTARVAPVGAESEPPVIRQAASCGCYDCRNSDDYDSEPEEYIGGIPMMPYSYRPNLIFSGEGPVYLGTELELSTGYDRVGERAMRKAAQVLMSSPVRDLVFLKGDGSISGHGFEAVFHPMSYDWLVENWPEDLLREMRNAGAMPHNSCGMHVHVSRTGFSDPVHAFKWIKFMYRNEREMSRLARRDPSEWGAFGRPAERAAAKWHAKGGHGARNRYTAINCIPAATFEVRIFASTLNRTRFMGSLGLVDASVEYARQLSTEDILKRDGWRFPGFRDYVHSFKKYVPLQKEMARLLSLVS